MTINANLDKLLDKAFEKYELEKLPAAPVSALAGVSDADAESLAKAFNIKTIGDLGRNKHFRAAVAIVNLVDAAK
ncbi:hypothetical protein AB0L53_35325 [Nonomuraea sp. NPDC052129]|uniref:hypothetical protein n=1 Tax=unclassified Nonomuraea TaxID=2593643 RepID=UPI0033F35EBB